MSWSDKTSFEDCFVCIKRLPRYPNLYSLINKRQLIGVVFLFLFKTSDVQLSFNIELLTFYFPI